MCVPEPFIYGQPFYIRLDNRNISKSYRLLISKFLFRSIQKFVISNAKLTRRINQKTY